MSDSDDDAGAFYSDIVALRKNSRKPNVKAPAARLGVESELLRPTTGSEEAVVTDSQPSHESSSGLPSVDDAIASADTFILRSYEKMQHENVRNLKKQEYLKPQVSNAASEKSSPSLFKLPDITWHVPMTSFEFLKTEKERIERENRAKALKNLRNKRDRNGIGEEGVVKVKKRG